MRALRRGAGGINMVKKVTFRGEILRMRVKKKGVNQDN